MWFVCFFFFKQKTAYEMRISDWSSDVCSSDLQELNARGISMPVVVLTGHGDVTIAVRAMKAGAVDFIEKPFEKAALITAVETAFERLADAEGRASRAADATILIAGISAREQDVLKGLAQGLPNKSIAFDLGKIGRAHV